MPQLIEIIIVHRYCSKMLKHLKIINLKYSQVSSLSLYSSENGNGTQPHLKAAAAQSQQTGLHNNHNQHNQVQVIFSLWLDRFLRSSYLDMIREFELPLVFMIERFDLHRYFAKTKSDPHYSPWRNLSFLPKKSWSSPFAALLSPLALYICKCWSLFWPSLRGKQSARIEHHREAQPVQQQPQQHTCT